jgi:alpha-L-fucosidase
MLLRMLISTVANGGNLIMNVGPTARGYLDSRAEEALKVYADWMKYNSRSIYGCTKAEPEFKTPTDCRLTQSEDGKRLYIHLFAYPFDNMKVEGLAGKIEYAQFLHDGSEVKFTEGKVELLSDDKQEDDETAAFFYLPHVKPNCLVPVIEVFLK